MLAVACVLKSGGEYKREHVEALASGFYRNLDCNFRFVCLTDDPFEHRAIECVRLPHAWPRWWAKICLFAPDMFKGPVFYADLDTVIVGNVDDIVVGHTFTVLENFWAKDRIGSGLMAWDTTRADLTSIYEKFRGRADRYMREYVTTERWGDQGFIRFNTPVIPQKFQTKFPGRVVSYKFHVKPNGGKVPDEASIVCYHGKPRPWKTPLWNRELAYK